MSTTNSITVMKQAWEQDLSYREYLTAASVAGVYPHSRVSYEYHCNHWDERWL